MDHDTTRKTTRRKHAQLLQLEMAKKKALVIGQRFNRLDFLIGQLAE